MKHSMQSAAVRIRSTFPARPELELHVYSDLQQVSQAVVRVGKWLEHERVDPECLGDVTLVLAEALNNVVQHAYGDDNGGDIAIRATLRAETLSMQIVDNGRPFDGPPVEVALQAHAKELAALQDGGYGWHLIRNLTEDIHFSHSGGKNRLTLVVAIRPAV
jgi:serine/threonine-protein kinase RsbW